MAKEVPLTCGKFAVVDDEDYVWLSKIKWSYHKAGYAVTVNKRMHRLVINAKKGEIIDHINGNGLDNRKENLRVVTKAQNMMNRNKTVMNTSGYKGVYYQTQIKRWMSQIRAYGKLFYLGTFSTPKEAALAYNKAALLYHGEYARLNEVD